LVTEAASEADDPFESLRRMGLAHLHFAEEHPGHYQVLFRAAAPARITEGSSQVCPESRVRAGERTAPHEVCCTSDGGRPSGLAEQAESPNHRKLLR